MGSGLRRVVITGVGALTSLGLDWASFRRALAEGQGGVRPLRRFDAAGCPVRFGSEIADFDAKAFVEKKDRKQLKLMARTSELAVATARLALDDGAVVPAALDPDRFGVAFGSGTIPGDLADLGPGVAASRDAERDAIDLAK